MARTPVVVDRPLFETAVKNAEASGPLKSLKDLYDAIVKQYSVLVLLLTLKPISAAIVKERLAEWKIPVKTGPGRSNKTELWTARVAELVSAVSLIRSLIPAEQAELLGLFDELQYTIEKPLEPATKTDEPANEADDEEIIDPNAVETAETVEPPVETAIAA